MTLSFVHDRLATAALLFAGIAAVWGFVAYLRRQGVSGSYWGILAVGELLFLSQGALGVVMWLMGLRPSRGIHWLYGITMLLTLPAYYAFSRGRDDRTAAFWYAILCAFLAGISLRAMGTG